MGDYDEVFPVIDNVIRELGDKIKNLDMDIV